MLHTFHTFILCTLFTLCIIHTMVVQIHTLHIPCPSLALTQLIHWSLKALMRISSDLHSQHKTGCTMYKISLYLFLSCVVIWFWFLEIGWSGNVSRGFVLITPASDASRHQEWKLFSHFPQMHFVSRVILAVVSCLLAATFRSILKSPNCTEPEHLSQIAHMPDLVFA